jgi:ABC-type molybdate transport system permease subunit
MTAADRRFYGTLLLVFGPLFLAGGWLAAFTEVGFIFILTGAAMILAAPIMLRSIRVLPLSLGLVALGLGWPLALGL